MSYVGTIDFQTNVSIAIMSFVIIIGLYVMFSEKEKIIWPKQNFRIIVLRKIIMKKF